VTVLAGDSAARRIWHRWLALTAMHGTLLDGEFDVAIHEAVSRAVSDPTHPIAVLALPDTIARWRVGRYDRIAAMVDEGMVEVPLDAVGPAPVHPDTRRFAIAMLAEALDASPAMVGRFAVDESLPGFGVVDLLARGDRIAVAIDSAYDLADPEIYRRDRERDVVLQMQGFIAVRVLADDVLRDPRPALELVRRALAARLGGAR